MEKNTVWAVVLSTLVLIVFFVLQSVLFPKQTVPQEQITQEPQVSVTAPESSVVVTDQPPVSQIPELQLPVASVEEKQMTAAGNSAALMLQYVTIETELATIVLSNSGGNIVSWKLKKHKDKDENVEMILSGINDAQAFSISLGGIDAQPITSFFNINRPIDNAYSVEFSQSFTIPGSVSPNADGVFKLTKRYDFYPNEYMFKLEVTFDSGNTMPGFNFGGNAYTLSFGPQIGPKFTKLDRYDYRQYSTYKDGKKKNVKTGEFIDSYPRWAAISGKYFTIIALPYPERYNINFNEKSEAGVASTSRLNIIRPAVNTYKFTDKYCFYVGPKNQDSLVIYNNGKNEQNLVNQNLTEIASSKGILAPLEKALKWLLLLFHKITPKNNYGIAIILLTLFIKILFFPLTKKGSEATLRMQALSPKIKEIQDKYKSNPQKMQAEMAAFYKQEGYNPLSGCLPMLLQIPIFISMYSLFNNHFDLRGAMFIPGWIPDLSVPESVWNFPGGFQLPILHWTALRILPFIYVGSQLLYGKVTQTPDQQGSSQMKMMMYVMPIVFFFILYDVPSGLLIYWIFSNLLTLVQQVIINKYISKKKEEEKLTQAAAPVKTAVVPPKKRK